MSRQNTADLWSPDRAVPEPFALGCELAVRGLVRRTALYVPGQATDLHQPPSRVRHGRRASRASSAGLAAENRRKDGMPAFGLRNVWGGAG